MVYRRTKKLADGTVREYANYWYKFLRNGEFVRVNTKQPNRRIAEQMEIAHKGRLAMGEAGIKPRVSLPTLRQFEPRFIEAVKVRCAEKPRTIDFYQEKMARLLEFAPLASARLDHIDEALVERFVQARRKKVMPATVNRSLATLRRALRLAYEWKVIDRLPRIRLLPGERNREFVLSRENEAAYLAACPQPLRDVAALILDTGLRVGEALRLEWEDIHREPMNGAKFGYLQVRTGKSRNARRVVSLTQRATEVLKARAETVVDRFVFSNGGGWPYGDTYLSHLQQRVREKLMEKLRLPDEFVIHSLRHTFLTRLGEAGVDVFTIMKIAGHSSVTVSQKYVHPTPESLERAFEKLEALNGSKNGGGGHTVGTPASESIEARQQAVDNKERGPLAQPVRAADS